MADMLETCVDTNQVVKGNFFSDDPVSYAERIFLLQLSLVTFAQGVLQVILKPFFSTPVVAQILGGLIVGPSILGAIFTNIRIYPDEGFYLLDTLGYSGGMIYLFLVGVKMDLSIVVNSSKKERVIGLLTFCLPILFALPTGFYLRKDHHNVDMFPIISVMESTTSFHAIASFLADLKILNTEVGRIASSASTISGLCSWITIIMAFGMKQFKNETTETWIYYIVSCLVQIVFISIVLRKIVLWIIRKTPEGEAVKESYLITLFLMILGTGFMGECFGQHFFFGPMIFGLVIPGGPPVGSALEDKLDGILSVLLLPLYFFNVGLKVILIYNSWTKTIKITVLLTVLGCIGKLIGTIIPCFFLYQITLQDAVTLALILNTKGVFDIQIYTTSLRLKYIDLESYGLMVIITMVVAGVIAPLVRFLYNPSRTYRAQKKCCLQDAKRNSELSILVCIYNQENVPTVLNILEVSNPTRESPMVIYLLNVVELHGRSTPLLISHKLQEKSFDKPTASDHIINRFRIYEKQNQGLVSVQPFTAITPVVTAHEDVCTLAVDKRTLLIIIPFHKQWNIDGTMQSSKWRNTNKKIIDKAPCSVGILIDRMALTSGASVLSTWSSCIVGVIFLGGPDDREAVIYGMRMIQHSNVNLTLHRLMPINSVINNVLEKRVDGDVINDYRIQHTGSQRALYEEIIVKDGVEIVSFIRNIQDSYNLILVGRRHSNYTTLLSPLTEWSEYPELGFFGDMFASSDFSANVSVLVMQQHSYASTDVISELALDTN